MKRSFITACGAAALLALASHSALAQAADPTAAANAYVNAPKPWQLWFPEAGSPMQQQIDWLMQYVLWIMTAVVVFVGVLMGYTMWRYRAAKNPVPGTVTHNTLIEVIWITVPTLLLFVIIFPSINLIWFEGDDSNPAMTVTVTAHQWYWEYSYNDVQGGLDYTSYMVPDDKIDPSKGEIRRLSVDHPLVLPVGEKVKFIITSADVLHGFYLPSLGVQKYAIPGTTVTSWTTIIKAGTYYGQCNQICGLNHDAMPIEIKAVPAADFQAWVKQAQANYTLNTVTPAPALQFADAAAN
jgi:cytochrome c oxidase subunit 2